MSPNAFFVVTEITTSYEPLSTALTESGSFTAPSFVYAASPVLTFPLAYTTAFGSLQKLFVSTTMYFKVNISSNASLQ